MRLETETELAKLSGLARLRKANGFVQFSGDLAGRPAFGRQRTIECRRLTLSWFIENQCGYCRLLRNPTLKVAGFHLPISGWF